MRDFTFSDEQLVQIRHDRARHPHPRVQQKMNVLWLKSRGLTHERIADLADTSLRTVQRVLTEFLQGGWTLPARPAGRASAPSWTALRRFWKTTSWKTRPAPPARPRTRSSD